MRALLRSTDNGEMILQSITQRPGHEDLMALLRRLGVRLEVCWATHVSEDQMLKPAMVINLNSDPVKFASKFESQANVRTQVRVDGSVLIEF